MNAFAPTAPPPLALRTRSLEQAREHLAGVFAPHRVACGTGALDFAHHRLDRRHLSLNRLRYGAEVLIDAPALERFYLLQLTLAGRCEIEMGRRTLTIGEGQLAVINPTRPYRKRWSADCVQLIARLDRAALDDAWTARHGAPPSQPLEFAFAGVPVAAAIKLQSLLCTADRHAAADRMLADALVTALPPAEVDEGIGATARVLRRAEAFMEAHLGQDLSIAEIAQAAGVTARTLERAFRTERGETAVARLKRLRLERARRELLAARDDGRSVTAVATAVGLLHAGRFAAEYRQRFGESPSETLRGA
jgi:AraC-like DNA-binding protein